MCAEAARQILFNRDLDDDSGDRLSHESAALPGF
jgi:hypothetical protein